MMLERQLWNTSRSYSHAFGLNRKVNAFAHIACDRIEEMRHFNEDDPTTWNVAVKDNIMVKGMPMECGSLILEGYIPDENATCIQQLVDAGVNIAGKTNMDEFGMGSLNVHSKNGPVINPRPFKDTHNLPVSSGGSSGGSAASVASGLCHLAIGSDTGGSVRLPASYCGIYGFKPSYGRISRQGLTSYASSLDCVGLMAGSIRIIKHAFRIMSGSQRGDMTAWRRNEMTLSKALRDIKLGFVSEMLPSNLTTGAISNFESFLAKCSINGLSVKEVQIPSLKDALDTYYITSTVEAASCLERYGNQHFGETPAIIPSIIPFKDRRQLIRCLRFGETVQERIAIGSALSSKGYEEAQHVRNLIKHQFGTAFADVDFLVSPTAPSGPLPFRDLHTDEEWSADVLTVPASLAGLPAINVPVGPCDLTANTVGVQIMAPYGKDEELLDFLLKL